MSDAPACEFCQLPVPRRRRAAGRGLYCCTGCELAAQVTQSRGAVGQVNWMLTRLGLSAFLTMIVMMFSMYGYREEFAAAADLASPVARQLSGVMRYLSLLFSAPVFVMLGAPLARSAWEEARQGVLTTDVLVAIGVGAAFVHSYVATVWGGGGTYFETGCAVLVFLTLGRWLEAQARLRAADATASLARLFPEKVAVERAGRALELKPEELLPGDRFMVPAGGRVAADGVVERGRAQVDEQVVTGESTPVVCERGDLVRAGSLAVDGGLVVRATAAGEHSTLGRLIRLLEAARRTPSDYERLTERVAAVFVPLVLALAVAGAWLGWRRGGTDAAILTGLSVALIACPCALGLATPLSVWAALGRAATAHVLFRDARTIERLARVGAVYFDKTGTLTTGTPELTQMHVDPGAGEGAAAVRDMLGAAAALAATSSHALARAIVARADADGAHRPNVDAVQTLPGRGLAGMLDGASALLGNEALMREHGLIVSPGLREQLDRAYSERLAVACVGWSGRVQGVLVFRETLRPEAQAVMRELECLRITPFVLTGDHSARGRAIGDALGIVARAELTPAEKLAEIRARQAAGRALVAMVGDGLNDAPALAAADVGLAMGCGTDLARESAGVCLLGNDLHGVVWSIRLARRTLATIRWNLFWAFSYNVVGIGLALAGRLSPVFAAGAMVASSILVVANSMRLSRLELPDGSRSPGAGDAATHVVPGIERPAAAGAAS